MVFLTLTSGTWAVDTSRSGVGFRVRHLGFAADTGQFAEFSGKLEISPDGEPSLASGSVAVASIHTGDSSRDEFLASPDFFDAERFPHIEFVASDIRLSAEDGHLGLAGMLTLHGRTQPHRMQGVLQPAEDGNGLSLRLRGELERRAYDLTFPQASGNADKLIANRVKLDLDLVLVIAGS